MSDVVFYVTAHTDDALLFRGEGLFTDLHLQGVRTVQILVTADDAGRTDGWWEAHEAACIESMTGTLTPGTPASARVPVNGHPIQRHTGPTWALYALRLREFAAADDLDRLWWVSYDVSGRPANLSGYAHDIKWFLFRLYGWTMDRLMSTPPNQQEWDWWGARSYSRTEAG